VSVRPYPEGIYCAWLASNLDGHIGAFPKGTPRLYLLQMRMRVAMAAAVGVGVIVRVNCELPAVALFVAAEFPQRD